MTKPKNEAEDYADSPEEQTADNTSYEGEDDELC
jgi:hypothetical protein